jgi:hypothetical protein
MQFFYGNLNRGNDVERIGEAKLSEGQRGSEHEILK